jgi:hypothetical protein
MKINKSPNNIHLLLLSTLPCIFNLKRVLHAKKEPRQRTSQQRTWSTQLTDLVLNTD